MPLVSSRLLVLVLVLSACSGSSLPPPQLLEAPVYVPRPEPAETIPEAPTAEPSVTTTTTLPPVTGWTAARALGATDIYPGPRTQTPIRIIEPTTVLDTPTVFLVLEDGPDGWIKVLLPGRPNHAQGWIRSHEVELFEVRSEVVVDLTNLTLEVRSFSGQVLLSSPVAIGSPASPTPSGTFFITDAISLTKPNGPWGPYAFGLSARSQTITEFNGGDGIIGIHGTNKPSSIGKAASLGCIRVPNEVITELWTMLEVGTPVTVK